MESVFQKIDLIVEFFSGGFRSSRSFVLFFPGNCWKMKKYVEKLIAKVVLSILSLQF